MSVTIENDDVGGAYSHLDDLDAHLVYVAVEAHAARRRHAAKGTEEEAQHRRVLRALAVAFGYRVDPD